MSNHSEFLDYEPVRRSQTHKVSETDAEHDSIGSPKRPDSAVPNVAANHGQGLGADAQDLRAKNSTGKGVSIREPIPRQKENTASRLKENWIIKRGHALSYAGVFAFTTVLFFRPYELFPALSHFSSMAYWLAITTLAVFLPSQLALEGNLTARPREINLILLLCLAALMSIPLALNSQEAWDTFNDTFIKAVVIFVVMVNVVRTERRLMGLIYLSLGVTFLLSAGALNDYRSGNLVVEGYRIKGILGGMFGNPNDLALHFVTMTPVAVVMMMKSRKLVGKVVYGLCALLTVAANVVTFSRAGFLGLLGMALVLLWKLGRSKRFTVVVVGSLCLAAFTALAPGNYGVRILSIFVPGLDPVGSSTHRRGILDRSILVSLRNPVVGIGMGNFHTVSLGETVSHNAYTQISAEMGTVALLFYMMFMLAPFKRLRRIERETFTERIKPPIYYLAIGLQASLVGYMISSFFASVAYQWYVYYLVGYAVCLSRMYQTSPALSAETRGT